MDFLNLKSQIGGVKAMTIYSVGFLSLILMSTCLVLSAFERDSDREEYQKLTIYHNQANSGEIRRLENQQVLFQFGENSEFVEAQLEGRNQNGLLEKNFGLYLREKLEFGNVIFKKTFKIHEHLHQNNSICLRVLISGDIFSSGQSSCLQGGIELDVFQEEKSFTVHELQAQKLCVNEADCAQFCEKNGAFYHKKSLKCAGLRLKLKKVVIYVEGERLEKKRAEFSLKEEDWSWSTKKLTQEYSSSSPLSEIEVELRHHTDLEVQSLGPVQFSNFNTSIKIIYTICITALFVTIFASISLQSQERKKNKMKK